MNQKQIWGSKLLRLLHKLARINPKKLSEPEATKWARAVLVKLSPKWHADPTTFQRCYKDFYEAMEVIRDDEDIKFWQNACREDRSGKGIPCHCGNPIPHFIEEAMRVVCDAKKTVESY